MEEAIILTKKELTSLLGVQEALIKSRELMYSGELKLDKYRGANYLLTSAIIDYNNLDEKAKKILQINVNVLEEKAVKILVDQGYLRIVKEDLLKKYGYSVKKE